MKSAVFKVAVAPSWVLVSLLGCLSPSAHSFEGELEGELKDAWLTGKAETVLALNEHLNQYSISARVINSVVRLNGMVGSEIDKSLATELMNGIAYIEAVENNLQVDTALNARIDERQSIPRRSFARWIDDLTTTAMIRSRLLSNTNVEGLRISVRTRWDIVTLQGQVRSEAESALAEEIARNTGDVMEVDNQLSISTAQ